VGFEATERCLRDARERHVAVVGQSEHLDRAKKIAPGYSSKVACRRSEKLRSLRGATPVPVRVTGEPAMVTLPVIVAEPVEATVAVGENITLIEQLLDAAKVVPQLG